MDRPQTASVPTALRALTRIFGPVGAATLARGAFGLVLATALIVRHPSQIAVEFFQLLFLQSIVITLTSGAGYVHAVHAGGVEGEGRRLLVAYGRAGLLVLALVYLALWAAPADVVATFVTPDPWKVHLLLAGALCAGLTGVLQGLLLGPVGAWRVFLPGVVAALVGGVCLLPPDWPAGTILVIWAGFQLLSLVFLIAANTSAVWRIVTRAPPAAEPTVKAGSPFGALAAVGFGLVNTVSLLIVYGFREVWSHGVAGETAEAGFFALRLSDTYLQVFVLGLVQTGVLASLRQPKNRQWDGWTILGLAVLCATSLGLIGGWLLIAAGLPLLALAVVAQGLSDLVRIPSSATTMAEVQRGKLLRYALVVLPGPILAAGVSLGGTYPTLWSLYLFQVCMTGLQIAAFLALRAADPRLSPLRKEKAPSRQGR